MELDVPSKSFKKEISWTTTKLVNPVAILETVFQKFSAEFQRFAGHDFESFWDSVRDDDPKWNGRLAEIKDRDDWKRRAIPYLIHADGAVFTKNARVDHSFELQAFIGTDFLFFDNPMFCLCEIGKRWC